MAKDSGIKIKNVMVELTDKKNFYFWFRLALFGFDGYNLVTVKRVGIDRQACELPETGIFLIGFPYRYFLSIFTPLAGCRMQIYSR